MISTLVAVLKEPAVPEPPVPVNSYRFGSEGKSLRAISDLSARLSADKKTPKSRFDRYLCVVLATYGVFSVFPLDVEQQCCVWTQGNSLLALISGFIRLDESTRHDAFTLRMEKN